MRVGFCSYYRKSENVYLSLRLAEFCREEGHEISIFSVYDRINQVHPRWDKRVVSPKKQSYLSWVKANQWTIWTEAMPSFFPQLASKNGSKTALLGLWDCVSEEYKDHYQMTDVLVCPCQEACHVFRDAFGLSNIHFIPWDPGLPLTRKSKLIDPSRLKLLVVLNEHQVSRIHPEILNTMWRVDITLIHGPKSLNGLGFRAVKRISDVFAASGQFTRVSDGKLLREDMASKYGKHDLLVWPSELEGAGLTGLECLSMGTPVLAYDLPPMSGFLKDGKNAALVGCELAYNWLGTPSAKADPQAFEEALTSLLNDRTRLVELSKFSRLGLPQRREKFVSGWRSILG